MLILLLILNLTTIAGLFWYTVQLRKTVDHLRVQVAQITPLKSPQPELADILGSGSKEIIAIEILNPMELAAKESWFAEKFGSLTPKLVRKIVHERALGIVNQQLQSFGAKAVITLHKAA